MFSSVILVVKHLQPNPLVIAVLLSLCHQIGYKRNSSAKLSVYLAPKGDPSSDVALNDWAHHHRLQLDGGGSLLVVKG